MSVSPSLSWDIPGPFIDMAVMASRLSASLAIYDEHDHLIYANDVVRRLYPFFDFTAPQTFESMLRASWAYGATIGVPVPKDPDEQVIRSNIARQVERLEFTRRYPTNLICTHLRLPDGRNAQLRVEPAQAGLEHIFSSGAPMLGLLEAIRQREAAEQKAAALDCLAFGVAILSPDCKLKHRNAAMADLLDRSDGLLLDGLGRLVALDQADSAVLTRLIVLACMGRLSHPTVAVSARGSAPGHMHTLSISPGAAGSGTAVVIVAPARLDIASVSGVLRRDFGLTPAEADLASQIGNGLTNDDVAKESGRAQATGRLHVKSILKKLDRGELANRGQTGLARWVAVLGAITGAVRLHGK